MSGKSEYVLVPKECSDAMFVAMTRGFNVYGGLRGSHRALVEMFPAAPAFTPSACEGGKLAHRIVLHCQNTPPEEAIEIVERLIVNALNRPVEAPSTSPAATGGEAGAERFECEHDEDTYTVTWPDGRWLIVSEDGTLTHGKSPSSGDFPAVRTSLAALANPSPQPANAVREVLETARDYISDAATGTLTYKDSGEGFKAMAAEDLARLDAALAAVASDPAPAGEAVDGFVYRDETGMPQFQRMTAPEDTARLREDWERMAQAALADQRTMDGLRRERDDAQKALKTARAETSAMHRRAQEEEYLRALIIGHCESWLEYYGRTKDRNRLTLMAIMRVARNRKRFIRALEEFAARSASKESSPNGQGD